ncbi:MAG: hypothetical protein ACRC33_28595 [Gemmataceae bacterium]
MRSVLIALLIAASGHACAADLSRIDRTLKKEPKYAGKPGYCLLAFGPDARHRVWLVLDGDSLHVDRDGDGDLTAPGEKVAATKEDGGDKGHSFEVGDLRVGGKTHKALTVAAVPVGSFADNKNMMTLPSVAAAVTKTPGAMTGSIAIDVEGESLKGGGLGGRVSYMVGPFGLDGVLRFGTTPADAPVIHLDGPLEITFYAVKPTWRGGASQDTILCVGTPGAGPGTFAMLKYEGTVPEGKHPTVEAVFQPKDPGAKPVKERYELKERC